MHKLKDIKGKTTNATPGGHFLNVCAFALFSLGTTVWENAMLFNKNVRPQRAFFTLLFPCGTLGTNELEANSNLNALPAAGTVNKW